MIKQLYDKMKLELENCQKLEEERRNVYVEFNKIQQVFESERLFVLDKEEIFKWLQMREVELEDKLVGVLDDQERLEDQFDSFFDVKKWVEEDVNSYCVQLEQVVGFIFRLEVEKLEFVVKVVDLEKFIDEIVKKQFECSVQEVVLEDEVKMLQSQFLFKDRKVWDMESKFFKVDQDFDIKLWIVEKEFQIL